MTEIKSKTPQTKPDQAEVAGIALDPKLFGGYLKTLRNPDKVLTLEAGGDISIYDDIGRDDRVGGSLRTRALAVIGKEWVIKPAGEESQDQAVADYVTQVFTSFPFDLARRDLLRGGVLKGYAISEIMWDVSEGDISIRAMKHRAQRRFVFDVEGDLRMLTRENSWRGENMSKHHPRKFQRFVSGDEAETPYGTGLGRELYWPWWFKKNGIKFWLIFVEKFAAPTPVGKYPNGTLTPEKNTLLEACQAFQTESGIIIPDTMQIDLVEAARSGNISTYYDLAAFMNDAMTITILGQTATTQGTAGKLGNDTAQEDVRADLVKADADALCESLNEQVVRWLVDYQFPGYSNGRKYPRIWIDCGDEEDHKLLSERDLNLSETGVRFKPRHYADTYGIPEETFAVVDPQKVATPDAAGTAASDFAEGAETELTPEQEAIEGLKKSSTAELQTLADPLLEPIFDIFRESASLEEARGRIADAFDDMDATLLAKTLTEALFSGALAGNIDAERNA
ncbi:MAG: hypothetical protein DRH56_05360 [Deltaproteobacteria bacterium]|nr:MAG: hypothetical protein DRH56_05360 [Deltaproteobacteria bacterium]